MPRLPPNWHETQDTRGRTYYFNSQTNETSWTLPPGAIEDPPPAPTPPPPGPPAMPKPNGPPQLPGGPPPLKSGPPPMLNIGGGGPPPIGSIPPSPANRTGPPQLPPIPTPQNQNGPPPMFGTNSPPAPLAKGPPPMLNVSALPPNVSLPPPSPANRTGPPQLHPLHPNPSPNHSSAPPPPFGTNPGAPKPPTAPPSLPSIPPNAPLQASPPSRQPSGSISVPPPMLGGAPPMPSTQPPNRGSVFMAPPGLLGALPPPPATRQPSGSVSVPPPMPGGAPPMPSGLPPTRGPSGSVSSGAPPPQFGAPPPPQFGNLPPTRQPSGSVSQAAASLNIPTFPPTAPPGRVSNAAPPNQTHFAPPSAPTVAALPPSSPDGALPYPWKVSTAANGKPYYYNTVTQEVSWTRPVGGQPQPSQLTIPSGSLTDLPLTTPVNAAAPTTSAYPTGNKEYSGSVQLRSGVFKSWEPKYITIKPGNVFTLYDNEQMKKARLTIPTKHILAIPINRCDNRYTIALYEYDTKTPPNENTLTSQASKTHYIDAGSNEVRQQLLTTLYDQGSIIRTPIWESMATRNKEPRFVAVFAHQLEIYKKSSEDEPDIIVPYTPKTFLQTTPSQFPLLYEDGKQYGPVGSQTFVIADHCEEDATLHYITMQASSDVEYSTYLKKTKDAIQAKATKVDPASLMEGYLYKASTNLQRWARRYFILRRDSLTYYKSREDTKPAGDVQLPNGFEVDLHPSNSPYPFSIFVAESGDEGTRQFLLCPLNEPDYDEWSNALSTLQSQKQVKKDPNSVKEGYLNVCQHKVKPARKYCVVTNTDMLVYHSRKDATPSQTVPIPKGCFISEASLPGDDVLGTQKLVILSVTNPSTNQESFFGFGQSKEREEWISALKGIVGDAIAKSHPDSYRECYVYKSKKKGSQGSLKYIVITPRAIYYSDKKESDVLSQNPAVQKRIKKFDLAGDAVIEEDATSLPGFKGLDIPSTGDEGGGEHMFLYFSDDSELAQTREALTAATASVDWRRDQTSIFEGYIWKSNKSGKSWTYRYAILSQTSLTFYKKKLDPQPISQLPLPSGFQTHRVSLLDTTVVKGSPDRDAIDHLASAFKLKASLGQDVAALAIAPPAGDTTSHRIWLAHTIPSITTQWIQVFAEFSSIGKQMHIGSIKEGYLAFNGSSPHDRRYISLHPDRIDIYPSRVDTVLEQSIKLQCGFDVLYKDNFLYISNFASEDLRQYTKFTNAVGGELLHIWLSAFQQAYQARTPTPSVRAQSYIFVSFNGQPQQFKFVVLTTDKLLTYTSRSTAYTTEKATEPLLQNAERQSPYVFSALDITEPGPLKIQVKLYNDTFIFDFRTEYEKETLQTELTTPPRTSGDSHHAAMAGFERMATRSAAFTMSIGLPPAPAMDDNLPPPPVFEDDEDPPPPPPPDDDDFGVGAPASFFTPAAIAPAAPQTVATARTMPLFDDDDDDDDIPEFIKEKKRAQAAAAAPAPTPTPAPAAPVSTFQPPATTSFKPPVRSDPVPGAGLGLDFDFSFDLPPAPDAFSVPPPVDDEPVVAAPVAATTSVRKPLFGANRTTAATPAPAPAPIDSKYTPVDFDDDDDLPPPGGGK